MGKRTTDCNHSSNTTCIHCMNKDSEGEVMRWMCRHRSGQMCPNCVNLNKDEKVELAMLCNHGPKQYCTNCLLTENYDGAKHMSFADYISKEKRLCSHGPTHKCSHCTMPSLPSFKVKKYCPNHPPYPRGLCTTCSPKPCTLARQKYRHVDNVQIVDKRCLDVFVQEWLATRETQHMLGLLFGRYESRSGSSGQREIALVYGLYKPNQRIENNQIQLERDDHMTVVHSLASSLGLQCIGVVYTSSPSQLPLISYDVSLIASLQWGYRSKTDFSSKFVSIKIQRNAEKAIEPIAFMLSDQCITMHRDGLLLTPTDPTICLSTTISSNKELLSSVIRNDQKMGSQEVTSFEPLFFLVELTVTTSKSTELLPIFKQYHFPAVSSKSETKDTLLKELMVTLRQNRSDPMRLLVALSDFYLLIELGSVIGTDSVKEICESITENKPLSKKSLNLLALIMSSHY